MTEFTPPQRAGIGEDEYRVPKVPVEVSVTLEGGLQIRGIAHVSPASGEHDGRERLLDLLLADEPFMPLTGEDGETRLIHKRRIVLIRFTSLFDADLSPEETEGAVEVPVRVELCGVPAYDSRVEGRLLIVMPPGHCRILDVLNVARPFFPLLADGEVSLVGLKHVVSVTQL